MVKHFDIRSGTLSNQNIEPHGPLLLRGFDGDCAEIEAEIELGDAHQAGLRVRSTADGAEQTLIGYDRDSQKLFCDTTLSTTGPQTKKFLLPVSGSGVESVTLELQSDGSLRLRVFIDASALEIFANGSVSLTDRVYPAGAMSHGIGLFAKGGTARLRSMTLWNLAPISSDRITSGAELFHV